MGVETKRLSRWSTAATAVLAGLQWGAAPETVAAQQQAADPADSAASKVEEGLADITDLSLERLLDAAVVSSTLSEQTVATAPSIVSVLGREQIRALGLRRLRDALQTMASVTVLATQGKQAQVSIRGMKNPANLLVTLDGQPLNDFYDGEFPVDFPLDLVERIEVIRGPGSALYGTGAFAGVISLVTRRPAAGLQAEIGGIALPEDDLSFGGVASVSVAHQIGDTAFQALVSTRHSQGPRFDVEDDVTKGQPYSKVPGYTNAFMDTTVAVLSVQTRGLLGHGDSLRAGTTGMYEKRGPLFGTYRVFSPDTRYQDTLWSSYLQYDTPITEDLVVSSRLTYAEQRDKRRLVEQPAGYYYDANGNGQADAEETFADGKITRTSAASSRLGGLVHLQHDLRGMADAWSNQLLVGVQLERLWMPHFGYGQNYDRDRFMPIFANYPDYDLAQDGRARTVSALFVQEQLRLRSLWVTLGLRLDHYSDFGTALSPRAALVWQAMPFLSGKLLYGRAFRAPTFQELYDETTVSEFGRRALGNEDLPAETTNTVEAGVEAELGKISTVRLNAFYNRTDNAIELDGTANVGGSPYVNYPGRRIRGAEVEAAVLLFRGRGHLFGNASVFDALQLGDGLSGWWENNDRRFINKELRDLPRLGLTVGAVGELLPAGRLEVSAEYSYIGASGNNQRFVNESLSRRAERPAIHLARLCANVALVGGLLETGVIVTRSFGEVVPISLSYRQYELQRDELRIMVIVRLLLTRGRTL